MRRLLLLLSLTLTIILAGNDCLAKDRPTSRERKTWNQEMQSVKTDYIARKLNLTDKQREEFIPLYMAMDNELRKINDETRAMQEEIKKKGKSCTDLEYEKAAEAAVELKGRENEIEKSYFNKFKAILSAQQLFELRDAEQDFTKELMKQHRRTFKAK
ncbi:MAG: hypothetical protein NC098_07895 [Lachnoclostridium sp.]|nr:hypothetical protein [Lachnoclostridium sp.]